MSSTFRNNNIRWQVVSKVSVGILCHAAIAGYLFVDLSKFCNVEEKLLERSCAQKHCENHVKLLRALHDNLAHIYFFSTYVNIHIFTYKEIPKVYLK